jgi:predicted P-loop ATPase
MITTNSVANATTHKQSRLAYINSNRGNFPFSYVAEKKINGQLTKVTVVVAMQENLEYLLSLYPVSISYDVVKKDVIYDYKNPYSESARKEHFLADATDFCTNVGIAGGVQRVASWLNAIADKNRYNPITDYLERCYQTRVRGTAELEKFLACYTFEDTEFAKLLFTKALIQAVAMPHNEGSFGGDGMLVLKGKQGIGKTYGLSKLAEDLPNYIKTGKSINPENKDDVMEILKYWIAELGELETSTKHDIGALKQFITEMVDEFRAPYGRTSQRYPRKTTLWGTVNGDDFLRDDENRRFWVVSVLAIDLDKLHNINVGQLWGEVYALWRANSQGFRLTAAERAHLNRSNDQYRKKTNIEQVLRDYLDFASDKSGWCWMSASDIASDIGNKVGATKVQFPPSEVGKALKLIDTEYNKGGRLFKKSSKNNQYFVPLKQIPNF